MILPISSLLSILLILVALIAVAILVRYFLVQLGLPQPVQVAILLILFIGILYWLLNNLSLI